MLRLALPLAAALSLAAAPALAADGAKLFQLQCKTCHADKSTPMGPTLHGVVGRGVGALADFKYSAGLKAKGGTWTEASLDTFLSGPAKFAPGTRMPTAVANPADRSALIGYLKTLK